MYTGVQCCLVEYSAVQWGKQGHSCSVQCMYSSLIVRQCGCPVDVRQCQVGYSAVQWGTGEYSDYVQWVKVAMYSEVQCCSVGRTLGYSEIQCCKVGRTVGYSGTQQLCTVVVKWFNSEVQWMSSRFQAMSVNIWEYQ